MIKKKLKELLIELKQFEVQTILVSEYKKRNDSEIFLSCTKLSASNTDIDDTFKSMHQSIMIKKSYTCKDWIVLDVIIKHSIKIFECQYKEKKKHKKWR